LKWEIDVDVVFCPGPIPPPNPNGVIYRVAVDLVDGRLVGDPGASAPGDRPVNDDNVAADPPASSGGATLAVPATNVNPIRGVPLSASLPGSKP